MNTSNQSYPSPDLIDSWAENLWMECRSVEVQASRMIENGMRPRMGVRYIPGSCYVEFAPKGMPAFYGYWQPARNTPAPLVVHTPGYGAEIAIHPDLVLQGYNVLHINPLGYMTPQGPDETKMRDGEWPVLADTVQSKGEKGYRQWLINCMLGIQWANQQNTVMQDRIAFFGTSQGGGAALLLASLYRGKGARCAGAEVPFLTGFALKDETAQSEIYNRIASGIERGPDPAAHRQALGFFDTISHAHRLDMPILLTAADQDHTCPPATINALYQNLSGTKLIFQLHGRGHTWSPEFQTILASWLRLYA